MTEYEKIYKLLQHSMQSKAWAHKYFPAGYQTLEVEGLIIEGQRDPVKRLKPLAYDFTDKTVLDIGCNRGGMLFAIQEKIAHGVGIDKSARVINCANRISSNLKFYTHDLDKDPLELLHLYNPSKKYDVVFMLSMCLWIETWRETIAWIGNHTNNCLFESNGENQDEQIEKLNMYFNTEILSDKSYDDSRQLNRKLIWCTR